eukprot:CAMPEP_0174268346 /NCGR_PEP_ID=MMETSP0439-20130205/37091_1 /TAXON_ID=0 /ORGANISM="Stereomyxa ramosa, Strain Chinc5" /LENGTH=332 /DNA_ID=CAMNT_0015356459 /DNA_START=475 /DNA_END=1469 /DNA_ORIENTATION=-
MEELWKRIEVNNRRHKKKNGNPKEKEEQEVEYLYFSQPITSKNLLQPLQKDIHPDHFLCPDNILKVEEAQLYGIYFPPKTYNLWMGSDGVTAQTHFDWGYNMYSQLYGQKTFLLSHPSAYPDFNLFPTLHPSRRQSQLDFGFLPHSFQVDAFQVTLKAGDVLFIPPFWFHRVIAINSSISVNLWVDSPMEDVYDVLEQLPIPFEENWDTETLTAALSHYIRIIYSQILPANPPSKDRLLNAIKNSYSTLFGQVNTENTSLEIEDRREVLKNCILVDSHNQQNEFENLMNLLESKQQQTRFYEGAERIVSLINKYVSDLAIKELILFRYFETV